MQPTLESTATRRAPARADTERLRAALRGELLTPQDAGYDAARRIWNAMVERRPALIARCAGVADIQACVRYARASGMPLAVRGGGHNIAGSSLCDGGLVVDLSRLREVIVDPETRRAQVAPGALLADLDHETQAFGLATPLGINSTTGVAGLTLGGGFGWLTRKHGMTVDNLIAADVVDAEGALLHANERQNPELFWALRGGGGNFGIVTRFELALHPVGPQVYAGLIAYPFEAARDALLAYRNLADAAPDELSVWTVLRGAPPLPFLPPELYGKPVLLLALCCIADQAEAERLTQPFLQLGQPAGVHLGAQPYSAWQQAFDPLLTPGARNYWKSHNFDVLSEGAIDVALEYLQQLPTGECEIFFGQLGGQMARVPADATAFPHRAARFAMNVHGRWQDPHQDPTCIAWARALFRAMELHATGGVYVNFLTEDERERVGAAYGANYARLASIKRRYDPDNLFRANQNIQPA